MLYLGHVKSEPYTPIDDKILARGDYKKCSI